MADGHLLVQFDEEELQGRAPEWRDRHAVHGVRRPRQGRHGARRGEQPRQVLGRGHVQPLAFGVPVSPLAVRQVPSAGPLHLARPVPRKDDRDVRGAPPRVLPLIHIGLPLGIFVLTVGHGEALQGLQQGQLLEEPALVHGVKQEDDLSADDPLPVELQVGIAGLERLPQHRGPVLRGELLAAQPLAEGVAELLEARGDNDDRLRPPADDTAAPCALVLGGEGPLVLEDAALLQQRVECRARRGARRCRERYMAGLPRHWGSAAAPLAGG
mmetsp:Transcript_10252/g.30855  ORF Transcript_10252/g.30855 Transcript_10252/m.30855 type:complete len:270 (+) Transcript_10252:675-1484(+)